MGPLNSSFNEMNVWGQILSTFSTILLNQEAILVLGRVNYSWTLWSRGKSVPVAKKKGHYHPRHGELFHYQ
jgi:hypothetical protein